jgi:4-hydroxy-3-methylbut-2-enyl diphosphate reductase
MSTPVIGGPPLFLAPMRVEELFVRRGARAAEVQRIGIGPVRATAARVRLAKALEPGRPVVLLGLGGGLRAGQRPGDIVVASELSALDSDETVPLGHAGAVAEQIEALGMRRVGVAPVVSSARIVHGEEGREKAAARGAAAVDMESLWCASLAREHPFAVVRVLIDVPGTELSLLAKPGAMIGACRRMMLAARALEHWSPDPGGR